MSTNHQSNQDGDCRQRLHSLSDYVDGTLDEALCAELDAHLADCPDCRVVVNSLTDTVELYRHMPDPQLPDTSTERLYRTLDLSPPDEAP